VLAAACGPDRLGTAGDAVGPVTTRPEGPTTGSPSAAAGGDGATTSAPTVSTTAASSTTAPVPSTTAAPTTSTAAPTTAPPTTAPPLNLYAATIAGNFAPQVDGLAPRVYVPNSDERSVSVIDPATMTVIDKFAAGVLPHHITPAWDLSVLYVLDTSGNTLVPIDPHTSKPGAPIPVVDPYNLYFTPDGQLALVIAERFQRIDLRDPHTWALLGSIPVPHPGVNHGDFSPDGRYFYATCEFSGWIAKVDLAERRVVAEVNSGRQPIDVKLAPDASAVFVADQARNGVIVLDPADLAERGFIPTGRGAHGLYPSRDGTRLYATNRLSGSVSVIDFTSRAVVATWQIPGGGSPDMGSVSADGSQFWVTGRYHSEVYVIDTTTGALIKRLRTGAGPHGLTFFPQPGRFSLGHTGNYR
jgi:YVTN family beta-propeller protein